MINVPRKIYLNIFGLDREDFNTTDFKDLEEVTWCTERMNDNDIEYTLSDPQPLAKDDIERVLSTLSTGTSNWRERAEQRRNKRNESNPRRTTTPIR